jgi:hypothetical protein
MIAQPGSIIVPKQKRITYMLERLNVRERPLRHGHCHDWKMALSFLPFVYLTSDCNSFKVSYACICYLLLNVVPGDELDIDTLNGLTKGIHEFHPKPEGEDPECFCGDTCKMEVSVDYKTL